MIWIRCGIPTVRVAGTPPPALVGRGEEIEAFDVAVQRLGLGRPAKSLLLTGLRGVGKTVLLGEFGRIASGHGWAHLSLEAGEDLDFVAAAATLARKALLRLSAGQRLADGARRAFGVLRSFQVRWRPDSGDITVGIDPVPGNADSGDLEEDLADLFIAVGEGGPRERYRGCCSPSTRFSTSPRSPWQRSSSVCTGAARRSSR